jgi:hypothetical protein
MRSKPIVESRSISLRLDFFPSCAQAVSTKFLDTKLVSLGANPTRSIPARDTRFYVQCDCACK